MSRTRRTGAPVVALAAALLMAACSGEVPPPDPTSQAAPEPAFNRYVALGDSSAAGPVIRPQQTDQPRQCARSAVNFPSLVAESLEVRTFVDVTCSGATLDSVLEQDGDLPAQLEAVTADTDLVTVGPLGANDVGLVQAALSCVEPGCAERFGDGLRDKVAAARSDIRRVLAAVKKRAPSATIVVIGYGRYLPRGACPEVQPITPTDGDFLQGLLDNLDTVLQREAARARVDSLDLRSVRGAAEHTACAPAGTRWVEGLRVGAKDGSVPYHPTKLGMQAFAAAVVGLVES